MLPHSSGAVSRRLNSDPCQICGSSGRLYAQRSARARSAVRHGGVFGADFCGWSEIFTLCCDNNLLPRVFVVTGERTGVVSEAEMLMFRFSEKRGVSAGAARTLRRASDALLRVVCVGECVWGVNTKQWIQPPEKWGGFLVCGVNVFRTWKVFLEVGVKRRLPKRFQPLLAAARRTEKASEGLNSALVNIQRGG